MAKYNRQRCQSIITFTTAAVYVFKLVYFLAQRIRNFGYFATNLRPFLCTFAGLNNAVVYQYLKSMRYALCSDLTHQAIVHDHIFHLAKNLDVAQLVYGIDCQSNGGLRLLYSTACSSISYFRSNSTIIIIIFLGSIFIIILFVIIIG